jgi:HlyD family secretion protein
MIDTTQLVLQRDALVAQRANLEGQRRALLAQAGASMAGRTAALAQGSATLAQSAEADAQAGALAAQLATAEEELGRTRRLFADSAATARDLNLREGEVAALREQHRQAQARAAAIRAQAATSGAQADVQSAQSGVPRAQAEAMADQIRSVDAQIRQLDARIDDAAITNPVSGTVTTLIASPGETVQPGSPLYVIADLGALTLRAFASEDQFAGIRVGAPVEVLVADGAGGMDVVRGAISWISTEAEFTPPTVQTRDERAELVYAFEVRVANPDGRLRAGMPGEVRVVRD